MLSSRTNSEPYSIRPAVLGCLLIGCLGFVMATKSDATTLKRTPIQDAVRDGIVSQQLQSQANLSFSQSGSDGFGDPEQSRPGQKSLFKAIAYSALIPGGGQYYLGRKKTARYFFATEALTWVGYFSFRTYGKWKENDFINYAAIHAGAQLEGKSDEFVDWVGFYENIREFNTLGRAFDPDRAYLPDNPENHWEWASPDLRQDFRDLRNRSREAYRRSDFLIGVAVLDRVISIIDAARSVGKINRGIGEFGAVEQRSLKLSVNPLSLRRQFSLTLYTGM